MLIPKRVKHRKVQRGSMKGKAKGGTRLNHGSWGIQAQEASWITNRQIEAARIAMTRHMKRGGIMFEIDGVDDETAKEALRLAINKLPIKCKIVSRETEGQA